MARPALIEKLMQPAKWLFKKELIPLDDMLGDIAGPGLKVLSKKLNVDFAEMPAAQLRQMVLAMIQTGGGLMVDSQGKIYFDPESMDTAVFDRMLKALRLPKWLTANTNFYVDKSHANASDTLVEGRGLSADKPFLSLQTAANYVANNYNVGAFTATIHVGSGDYADQGAQLVLGNFANTTGNIFIQGNGPDLTILPRVTSRSSAPYELRDLRIKPINEPDVTSSYLWALGTYSSTSIVGNLRNVIFDLSRMQEWSKNYYIIYSSGDIRMNADNLETPNGISILSGGKEVTALLHTSGGTIVCQTDIKILDNLTFSSFAYSTGMGKISFTKSSASNPGRMPQVNTNEHTCTGKRYNCTTGGTIAVGSSGAEFFPGSTAGTVDADTYSWYK